MKAYGLNDLQNDLKSSPEGLPTGFRPLDEIAHIPQGALTVVAARPSHGKTTFLLNLLINMLIKSPEKAFLYFTMLEPARRIGLKVINILGGEVLDPKNNVEAIEDYVRAGHTSHPKVEAGKESFRKLTEDDKLWIVDDCETVEDITERVEAIAGKVEVGAVFIDYLQKIGGRDSSRSPEVEYREMGDELLKSAKKLQLPFILGAQLQWDDKRHLRLDNLYEVSAVAQDASLLLGLYNHAIESAQVMGEAVNEQVMGIKVTVLKNRFGLVNESVHLRLESPTMKVSETRG